MNLTWRCTIAVATIFVSSACFWEGGVEGTTVVRFLPIIQTDFSDLDPRDAQNRPVSSPSATGELAVIFAQNASELATRAAPHAIRDILLSWNAISHLFKDGFLMPIKRLFGWQEQAIFRSIRKVVHNVNNLWITPSDGIPQINPSLMLKSLSKAPQQVYLRC